MKRTIRVLALVAMIVAPTAVLAGPASAVLPSDCTGKADTYFQFIYRDGSIDQGCADQNNVTPVENPGQLAPMLHVSCSDTFGADGRAVKSILGTNPDGSERLVAEYLIIKDQAKKAKTCGGGTPVPAGGTKGLLLAAGAGAAVLAVGSKAARRRRRPLVAA